MQHAVCSLLEVLSGNELSCNDDLLAMAVELQLSIYWTANPILNVRFVIELPFVMRPDISSRPAVSQAEGPRMFEDGMICPGLPGELPMNYANIKYFDIADGEASVLLCL